jgi:hypothetical protein
MNAKLENIPKRTRLPERAKGRFNSNQVHDTRCSSILAKDKEEKPRLRKYMTLSYILTVSLSMSLFSGE